MYWVVQKVRAAKDLNLINEIKNLNLLRFNFPSKSARIFRTTQYITFMFTTLILSHFIFVIYEILNKNISLI